MPDSQSLINKIVDFYGRYLSCSRNQLDVLALWTFHTHCFRNAPFSPALNIHSRQKQSGKTTCLELLQMLCDHPSFHTSPSPALVIRQTQGLDESHPFVGALLLDDCRFTTALQGVLSASFRWSGRQVARSKNQAGDYVFQDRINFFPKAFAGNCRLPDCLRDISIPIPLEPKPSGSRCRRFHQDVTKHEAKSLWVDLHQWYEDHTERLAKMTTYEEPQFPPELSSRQQDCAEPLLHIADLIGGDWPRRARNALVSAFALSAFEDFYSSKQILGDVQDAFLAKDHPEWISSKDLLEFLHIMDDRTWDEWSKGKPMSSKDLAALLAPFGIKSKNHRTGEGDKVAKGYNREDFLTSWQKYLPETCGTGALACGEGIAGTTSSVAAELQNSSGQPAAVLNCQAKEADSVAANSKNEPGGTVAAAALKATRWSTLYDFIKGRNAGRGSQPQGSPRNTGNPVAADLQSSHNGAQSAAVLSRQVTDNSQELVAKSEPKAPVPNTTTVIAGEQYKVAAAEFQKRRYSDPLREASMRAIEKALSQ